MARHLSRLDKVNYGISVLGRIGISKDRAIGVMGSLAGESGLNLNTEAFNPNDPGGSEGIGQWNNSGRATGRKSRMRDFVAAAMRADPKKTKYEAQMDFVAHELTTTHKSALNAVKNAPNMVAATRAFTTNYEAPSVPHHAERAKKANYFAGLVSGSIKDKRVKDVSDSGATFPETTPTGDEAAQAQETSAEAPAGVQESSKPKSIFGKLTDTLNSLTETIGGAVGAPQAAANETLDSAGNVISKAADNSLFGDTSGAAMLGSIAGGIFGGAPGAVVGGLLGQTLDRVFNTEDQTDEVAGDESEGILGGVGRALGSLFGGSDGGYDNDGTGLAMGGNGRPGDSQRVGSRTGEPGFGGSAAGDYFGGVFGGNTFGASESGSHGESAGNKSGNPNGGKDKSKSKAA